MGNAASIIVAVARRRGRRRPGLFAQGWLVYLVTLAVVLLALLGLFLWLMPKDAARLAGFVGLELVPHDRIKTQHVRELGSQILGGASVAFAVLIVELIINRRLQEQSQREQELQNLRQLLAQQEDLNNIDLSGRVVDSAYLPGRSFRESKLTGISLANSVLLNCSFDGALLDEANFSNSLLARSSFVAATLRDATFFEANLRQVNFFGANLRGADFDGADLAGAIFSGTILNNANFEGANVDEARFDDVSYNSATNWPSGFSPQDSDDETSESTTDGH